MKTKFILSTLLAVSGVAGFANTAKADDLKIFGLRIPAPPHLPAPPPLPAIVLPSRPVVVVQPAPVVTSAPSFGFSVSYNNYPDRHEPRGYWKEIIVQDWVPGRWVVSRGPRGRELRTFEPGHYVRRTDRVWVDYRSNDRDHDGRRDRD